MELKGRKEILKEHKLRITDCRLDVLDLFISRGHALSQKDLEDELTEYDRVTLYRTLHSFMENGLLHRIPSDSGFATYGLCFDTCTPEHHHHDHVHFKCMECGQLECIDDHIKIPEVSLPNKYQASDIDVIINGLCANCNN